MKTMFRAVAVAAAMLLSGNVFAQSQQGSSGAASTFAVGRGHFELNGEPFVVKAAELHYPRIPREYWEHRIEMCRALGMNTICMYVFWNFHEPREGQFDFTGQRDIAAFCRLAQKHGMYVIVRPGPYVCAEWEMGGLPWWLLKRPGIQLRENDDYFVARVDSFMRRVGEQLAPLTIGRGGPIIMVQVENEYGSYGENKPYVARIRDIVRQAGFDDVTLFQCDWASNFTKNGLDDLVWTMNFGTGANIDSQFKRLRELRPESPLMCSEYWSGWFDKWGARHETRPAAQMVAGIDEMLSKGISFSLYMTHGGTSFGHWAGANSPGFQPDVTSYDYDAPINEQGLATPKYDQLRATLQRHSPTRLPRVPRPVADTIGFAPVELSEFAPLMAGVEGDEVRSRTPLTFEQMDMGWGAMVYTTDLPTTPGPAVLTIGGCHDYAQVFVDGQYQGTIDRVQRQESLRLPKTERGQRLAILVEGMGRINFGRAINDPKGITGAVTLTADDHGDQLQWTLNDWTMTPLPDTYAAARQAFDRAKASFAPDAADPAGRRGYYRATFRLRKAGDTFINMERFGKGQVWVNGHALGRYWRIGPQQTLYAPGCWLRRGENEIIVLDIIGPDGAPTVSGQARPTLDKLLTERPRTHRKRGETLLTDTLPLAAATTLAPGNGWQTIRFAKPMTGRRIAIEATSAHDGGNRIAIAEIYALGADGKRLSREPWTALYADSEDIASGNNTADKTFDLQESTYWLTDKRAPQPHVIAIDLGADQTITALELLPRAEQGAPNAPKDVKVRVY